MPIALGGFNQSLNLALGEIAAFDGQKFFRGDPWNRERARGAERYRWAGVPTPRPQPQGHPRSERPRS